MNRQARDLLRDLGARIKQLRCESGLSQRQAAAYVGVSQSTWSRVERDGVLSVGQLLRLQELFGVETMEAFFGELPSQRAARKASPGSASEADV